MRAAVAHYRRGMQQKRAARQKHPGEKDSQKRIQSVDVVGTYKLCLPRKCSNCSSLHREVISELWAPAIFRKRILQVNRERLLQVGRERLIPFARLGENLLIANVKTKWHAANGQCDLLRCQRFPLCVWHRPWA